ncbi:uracil glycosylase [Dictyostelium discoideum AX4]|uniref:Uracil-DNA glycosylase n=1 Tax=Dictyostelium discoideum TaxID=44689 RepID=UNG_DICDI|nr:uracil glycosylase [Dictyostelium discoideum AX4]P53766.2 RecName: Full=Uracil-DNA glycosylase; Short=UDG [Dictyostelium discoideum]EAL68111.1 uracil glycosylase [Dictyostelium discoideum AX4]|eukprot:XP_642149.1 uracil glycosylase [Dictyostelium discoideum AX4]
MSGKITDFFEKKTTTTIDEAENKDNDKELTSTTTTTTTTSTTSKKKVAAAPKKKAAVASKKRKHESSDEETDKEEQQNDDDDDGEEKVENNNNNKKLKNEEKSEEINSTITDNNYYDDIENYFTDKQWKEALSGEFGKAYFKKMITQLNKRYSSKEKPIYPPKNEIFSAFNYAHLEDVKVVIIGQDPYHGKGQAHGLSFSVKKGVSPPPSLINIYKELETDIEGFKRPLKNGFLEPWARQGVFLLNAVLTVEEATPNSHKDFGWADFTDAVLKILSKQDQPIVFILWGGFAQKKEKLFTNKNHLVLKSGHPSPLSIKHFIGCKHFSKSNEFLKSKGIEEIDWKITE